MFTLYVLKVKPLVTSSMFLSFPPVQTPGLGPLLFIDYPPATFSLAPFLVVPPITYSSALTAATFPLTPSS
ncbi:hypothetical protein AN958_00184 [Leucoagaricus sp. SymC.cos]|nr:hypothetical protein AN958_00184 [Leucoagaricus sp. SymC.cos]